ncbi:MAG: HAD family hydrolase [Deltaproteobacteria bacterium]|nr:HAD family hydrolase [Deltaproteobacteria bacterium]
MAQQVNDVVRAVFLDRDGVLNRDKGYVYRESELELLSGVAPALRRLKDLGFLLIVVTNQSGVARGLYGTADVERFHDALSRAIAAAGGPRIDDYLYCPHHENGTVAAYAIVCDCRKPKPGMLLTAAKKHGIELTRSFMIGDKADDIEAGRRCGVTGIQVGTAYGPGHPDAMAVVNSLEDALGFIH